MTLAVKEALNPNTMNQPMTLIITQTEADYAQAVRSCTYIVCVLKSQYRPSRTMFVCKIQVNPIHTILKNMAFIMTVWIGNGVVLKSSSQWQLKEF